MSGMMSAALHLDDLRTIVSRRIDILQMYRVFYTANGEDAKAAALEQATGTLSQIEDLLDDAIGALSDAEPST